MKDNQIICKGDAIDKFNLDYSRQIGRYIPIQLWSEHTPVGSVPKGSRTYLVSYTESKEL